MNRSISTVFSGSHNGATTASTVGCIYTLPPAELRWSRVQTPRLTANHAPTPITQRRSIRRRLWPVGGPVFAPESCGRGSSSEPCSTAGHNSSEQQQLSLLQGNEEGVAKRAT